jgi:two-component system, OmpR family, sensor histidine kinase KdpD
MRGTLRIYLGSAPGVGKTYAMLGEGHRRRDRHADVVVGFVETHGRQHTEELTGGLEVVPRKTVTYRGAEFPEMDVDAILRRRPQIALVDELAHTNIPGSRNEKRWQDIEELLDAGITVLSTVNIQHLESVNDVVERITGVPQRETVPDAFVRSADQVELVDITPEALRRRMAHGNIYGPDKVDAALGHYFRTGNLTALRELSLLWVADKVDDSLQQYRHDHHIVEPWETKERVLVALTGGPEGATLIRRAARIAGRSGADLLAVHVMRSDGLSGADPGRLAEQQRLVESLGGTLHQVLGEDVPKALLEFARAENATQLILGASRRSRLGALLSGPGIGATATRYSGDIDVHMVTHDEAARTRVLPALPRGLGRRRQVLGLGLAAVVLPLLTVGLANSRASLNLSTDLLAYLLAVVLVALVGGLYPALLTGVAASILLNYYFTPPLYTLTIADRNNAFALLAFVLVGAAVAFVVELAARRTLQAGRAETEAEILVALAGSVLRGESSVGALLERARETFRLTSATLLERQGTGPVKAWEPVAGIGPEPCLRPDDSDAAVPVGENLVLAVRGPRVSANDMRILAAFATQAATALEQERLAEQAAAAVPLAEADRLRTALLAAVSHDLRTPLAAAKAAVTSLRSSDVQWKPEQREELLAAADESLDRLHRLVDNLLDMSRLQAGALSVFDQRVGLGDVVSIALDGLGVSSDQVELDIPDDTPDVRADPMLLERVVANLASNALRHAPGGEPPRIAASVLGDRVELRVVDRGPGISLTDRDRVFAPFQRLGDTDNNSGIGLGLALSRGLTEAMGGSLSPEDTPGGGLTMVVSLPVAVDETGESGESGESSEGPEGPESSEIAGEPGRRGPHPGTPEPTSASSTASRGAAAP